MHMLKTDSRGAASLITVIFVAIVLTIMTLGFLRLALNEQRISTDDDLTTRAYFASESGVEDVKRALDAYVKGELTLSELNADSCEAVDGYDNILSDETELDTSYVCQLIDLSPADYEYYFDGPNQTTQIPIYAVNSSGSPDTFNRLSIYWHLDADPSAQGDGVVGPGGIQLRPSSAGGATLPDVTTWNSQRFPAMLRVSVISHPDTSTSFGRGDIRQYVVFLNPVNNGSGDAGNVSAGTRNGQIIPADCADDTDEEYYCVANFQNFENDRQYYLRITSLYRDAHVQARISTGGGAGINNVRYFDKVQAVADVTGQSGDVLRRVETRINLVRPNLFPDAAITSLDDICKNFFITDLPVDFDGYFIGSRSTSCTLP